MYNRARHIETRVYRIRELASETSPEFDFSTLLEKISRPTSSPRASRGLHLRSIGPFSWKKRNKNTPAQVAKLSAVQLSME